MQHFNPNIKKEAEFHGVVFRFSLNIICCVIQSRSKVGEVPLLGKPPS